MLSRVLEAIVIEKVDVTRIDIDSTFGKCKRNAMSLRSGREDRCCGISSLGRPAFTAIAKGQQSDIKGLMRMYPKLEEIAPLCRADQITCDLNGDEAYDNEKDWNRFAIMGFHPIILYRDIKTKDGIKKEPTCVEESPLQEQEIHEDRHRIENAFSQLKDDFPKNRSTRRIYLRLVIGSDYRKSIKFLQNT